MLSKRKLSARAFSRYAAAPALALCLLSPSGAQAVQKNKKNQSTTGRIEVSTQPGGHPITIDGQPAGEATEYVRAIELAPGRHTVEIRFPNDTLWSQVFNIVVGRKNCIALNYRPQTIEVAEQSGPAAANSADPAIPQSVGSVQTVDLGDVTGTVCDCGETPAISKVPWWKRAAGKLKPK